VSTEACAREQAEHEEGGAPASYAFHDPCTPPGHGPFPTAVWCVGRAMHRRLDQSRSVAFGGLLEGLIETDSCCDTLLVEGGVDLGEAGHLKESPSETEAILAEQIQYYRARALEYDEWWERRGRYDRGSEENARWFSERTEVLAAFDRLKLQGDVLELAPGTGIWTERLARTARSVTAVDASVEMIAINRERMGEAAATVSYVQADLFAWEPTRRFDAAVFCFWISHVPRERLDAFLQTVSEAVDTGGRVFFVDGRRQPSSTAIDHDLPDPGSEVMTRRLNDGRAYRVVKNFWPSEELESRCWRSRLDVTVAETATYFQYGYGQKA
jgi:SAM-dependent methyltransferase